MPEMIIRAALHPPEARAGVAGDTNAQANSKPSITRGHPDKNHSTLLDADGMAKALRADIDKRETAAEWLKAVAPLAGYAKKYLSNCLDSMDKKTYRKAQFYLKGIREAEDNIDNAIATERADKILELIGKYSDVVDKGFKDLGGYSKDHKICFE